MPFSKLLTSNKSYENLFLNHLLTPAFIGRFQREKQSREQVLGAGEGGSASFPVSLQERGQTRGGVWASDIQITSQEPLRDYSFWKGVWM